MTERPRLARSRRDFSRIAYDVSQTTTVPSACRGGDIVRAATGPEPPFLVTCYTEPVDASVSVSADRLVVVPAGYVDMDTAPVLESALVDAVDSHPEVCCDLAAVRFFSAAGVHVLLTARGRAGRSGSRFSVRGAYGITRRVLRITQVDRLLVNPDRSPGAGRSDIGSTP
jgi:anti-anti-sigma factor